MSSFNKYLLSVFFLLVSVSIISAQNSQAEMFEKAKYTMETRGDLQSAILLFEDFIKQYPDQKEYCAKSQFYIGLCYEKLGYQEAKKAYEKVIANYPSEEEIVLLARDKLASFHSASTQEVRVDKEFQLMQVWADQYDHSGKPSPDGSKLSFVNWDVPCLAILDIASGKRTNIPSTTGYWKDTSIWPENSIWSPDGKKLAYVWYGEEHVSIRTVGIDSSEPVEIYSGEKVKFCQPYSWSSNGEFILAVLCLGNNNHDIVSISLDDHSVKSLKKIDWGHPWCSLSPDDKTVAYSHTPDRNSPQTDIYLLDIEKGTETRLIEHPKTDFCPLWMPGGNTLVFFSDRTGSVSAWSQKVTEGKAFGEEKFIKDLHRTSPMNITQKGHLFMTFYEGGNDIYSAVIDPENGRIVSEPMRIVESDIGWNAGASYSPDGKRMAFVSHRGVLDPSLSWGQQTLVIRDLESGKEKALVPKLSYLLAGPISPPCWSPDGNEIVVSGNDENGKRGVFIIDVDDGSHITLLENEPFEGSEIIWSHTNDALYYRINGWKEKNGLYRIDRTTNTQSRILAGENIQELALHPNGTLVAFSSSNMRTLKVFNMETGELQELLQLPEDIEHTTLVWSPDGKWLYFMKCYGDNKDVELWRMSPEGKDLQLIYDSLPHFKFLAFHPDGKTIVFTVGKMSGSSSLWVMKNFIRE